MPPSSSDGHTLKTYATDLVAYDAWANRRAIEAVAMLPEGDVREECLRLMSHAVRATTRWLERILEGASSTVDRADPPDALERRVQANARAWHALLEERTAPDFAKDVVYTGSTGEEHRAKLRVIVAHVFNHATHHRAQVIRHIRLAGFEPPVTDLIVFDRERTGGP